MDPTRATAVTLPRVQNRCMSRERLASPRARMVRILVVASVLVVGCQPGASSTPSATITPAGPPASVDADGWTDLFDGQVTRGLRAYGGGDFPSDRWQVVDGALRTVPGEGLDLATEAVFEDFELEFTWAVSPGGNSGVMIGVQEGDAPAWASGPEYQLLDDGGHPDGSDPRTSAAALYALLAPATDKRIAPVGDLNRSRIVARDGHVEHWLDEELVLAYDWDDPNLREAIAASKFASSPAFMATAAGRVVLQHHGEEVWFGSVRIRALPAGG
jgi:Domain of Unknown Function (DUF1080)